MARPDGRRASHVKNVAFSVAGTLIPMVAGVLAVPMLLVGLGPARLGLFTLCLGLFGFAGLLDLGLGRALTRTVAHELGHGRPIPDVSALVYKGLVAVAFIGMLWGAAMFICSTQLASLIPTHDAGLLVEAGQAIRALALLVPVVLLTGALNGAAEGIQAFKVSSAIRAGLGTATYLVPAVVALRTNSLVFSVFALVTVRLAGLGAFAHFVRRAYPSPNWAGSNATSLWRYSGWLSVSNIVAPLMTTADRYYLAVVFPPAAIASYTVVFDALYRLTAMPFASMAALFPSLSSPGRSSSELNEILFLALRGGTILWLAPLAICSLLAEPLLSAWLGDAFAGRSATIARWIILGVAVNGFALVPFVMLQAAGEVVVTIKYHLMEIIPYVAALVFLSAKFGVLGAAMAWSLRVLVDAVLQFRAARRLHPVVVEPLNRMGAAVSIAACVIAGSALLSPSVRFALAGLLAAVACWQGLVFARRYRDG